MLRYVVTGCGHSGTGYMARLLQSAGLNCGHEVIFRANYIDVHAARRLDAASSWAAVPFLGHPVCAEAQIILAVRHPLAVIRSTVHAHTDHENNRWAASFLNGMPDLTEPPSIEWACAYYLGWHRLAFDVATAASKAVGIIRVEQRRGILKSLGLTPVYYFDDARYNRHTDDAAPRLSWDDVPERYRGDLQDMARSFGYVD